MTSLTCARQGPLPVLFLPPCPRSSRRVTNFSLGSVLKRVGWEFRPGPNVVLLNLPGTMILVNFNYIRVNQVLYGRCVSGVSVSRVGPFRGWVKGSSRGLMCLMF